MRQAARATSAATAHSDAAEDPRRPHARDQIARLRAKLLDLSGRNPLISFRHSLRSSSHVRLIDELPDYLWARLLDGKSLSFKPLPEPPEEPLDERTDAFALALEQARASDETYLAVTAELGEDAQSLEQLAAAERSLKDRVREELGLPPRERAQPSHADMARAVGLDPNYDLPRPNGVTASHHHDAYLQTLLFPEEMERKLRGLLSSYRTFLQELGINTLYLALGFLEWFESDSSSKPLHAPLLLLPLKLDRSLEHGHYRYKVTATGDEAEVNATLGERLAKDFNLRLPECGEEGRPEAYFASVTKLISDKRRWRIRRFGTVGLFAFSRLAMWQDLDPARWPDLLALDRHPLLLDLLAGRAGETGASVGYGDVYDVDDPAVAAVVPLLIAEADSSQHSAIVDVMRGKNLALEGPPGTGKSQTITNLIAAMLADRKRVLFIAEKAAALEVVANRLERAGLNDFCLELHSTKASKKDVLAALDARLELSNQLLSPAALDVARRELEILKTQLNTYCRAINAPFGALGLSAHQILWRAERARTLVAHLPEPARRYQLSGAERTDGSTFEELKSLANEIVTLERDLIERWGAAVHHPWRGMQHVCPTVFEREALEAALKSWRAALDALERRVQAFQSTHDIEAANLDLGRARSLVGQLTRLPMPDPALDLTVLASLVEPPIAAVVDSLIGDLDRLRADASAPSVAANDTDLLAGAARCAALIEGAERLALSDVPSGEFTALAARGEVLSEAFTRAEAAARRLGTLFGLDQPPTCGEASRILEAIGFIGSIPAQHRRAVLPGMAEPELRRLIDEAAARASELNRERGELAARFELARLGSVEQLEADADHLAAAGIFWFLRGGIRAARARYRSLARGRKDPWRTMPEHLRRLANHSRRVEAFEAEPRFRQMLGAGFKGLGSDFSALQGAVRFVDAATGRFMGDDGVGAMLLRQVLRADIAWLERIAAAALDPALAELRARLGNSEPDLPTGLATPPSAAARLDERIKALRGFAERVADLADSAEKLRLLPETTPRQVGTALLRLSAAREARARIAACAAADRLGPLYQREATDAELLRRLRARADLLARLELPAALIDQVLRAPAQALPQLRADGEALADLLERADEARASAAAEGELDLEAFLDGADLDALRLAAIIARIDTCLAHMFELPAWSVRLAALARARDEGLGDLLQTLDAAGVSLVEFASALEHAFWRDLVQGLFKAEPLLARFSGLSHEQARRRFAEADRKLLALERQWLRAELAGRSIESGVRTGPRSGWTNLALVQNEIGKKKRHIPLRQLFRRAGTAIQQMKPCFMMSPLSVAQFLAPGDLAFDLVVIDEASQMRPEEAIGALGRAQQVVVVGDPKQLPPTSFFDRLDSTDAEDDEDAIDSESILDLALATFRPARRLLWHYRSRHGSLIAFSNRHFYDDQLIVFPAPVDDPERFGIAFHKVDGRYHGRTNALEAQTIADAAIAHMRSFPEASLGVVAMNKPQAELIQLEIDRLVARDEDAAAFMSHWESEIERFFVKNLETVQGDERDVILISTVYGPDAGTGVVYQRFGPINSELGWRRLNVLFSRAKCRMVVYSSMEPHDIVVGPQTRRGVVAFHDYLDYARNGRLDPGEVTGREPDSDFEVAVAECLDRAGFQVVPQLGVAGYFIDLVVRDPDHPGHFLLGVECDGASYHSARSARDRDRLRQEILERLGWELHRIWSTDWFNDPRAEAERLLRRVAAARGGSVRH